MLKNFIGYLIGVFCILFIMFLISSIEEANCALKEREEFAEKCFLKPVLVKRISDDKVVLEVDGKNIQYGYYLKGNVAPLVGEYWKVKPSIFRGKTIVAIEFIEKVS